ncbi:hypothetical protein F7725_005318 [Dissostichus mawsoni]|uniref:Uncharacterized protein n=1 Tax=Dissostichus mawsoni TaxID=36200 RepID=A0A7J5YS26_DISMA|nr:hypothetical protein F7725_005318 [Dissostichus mawsoni]
MDRRSYGPASGTQVLNGSGRGLQHGVDADHLGLEQQLVACRGEETQRRKGEIRRGRQEEEEEKAFITFALAGAEAASLLAGGGGALVEGRGLLVALTAGDFTVHVIGQVPQQTHAVLYQLQIRR